MQRYKSTKSKFAAMAKPEPEPPTTSAKHNAKLKAWHYLQHYRITDKQMI